MVTVMMITSVSSPLCIWCVDLTDVGCLFLWALFSRLVFIILTSTAVCSSETSSRQRHRGLTPFALKHHGDTFNDADTWRRHFFTVESRGRRVGQTLYGFYILEILKELFWSGSKWNTFSENNNKYWWPLTPPVCVHADVEVVSWFDLFATFQLCVWALHHLFKGVQPEELVHRCVCVSVCRPVVCFAACLFHFKNVFIFRLYLMHRFIIILILSFGDLHLKCHRCSSEPAVDSLQTGAFY